MCIIIYYSESVLLAFVFKAAVCPGEMQQSLFYGAPVGFANLLPQDGALILNGDIENYNELADGLACRTITFGSSKQCA